MGNLDGRVALVTGGGRGIGQGITLALAEAGADVAINYNPDNLTAEETAAEVRKLGRRAELYQCDISESYESAQAMVNKIAADFGKLDVVVNNAGIASRGRTVFDTDVAEMARVVQVHFFGAFYVTKAALEHLRKNSRGDVVYISSGAARGLSANGAPYNVGKTAAEAFFQTLAKEERKNGIRVNVVRSGLIDTEMGRRLARATRGVSDIHELDPTSPFGRVGNISDIGNAVAFLVSPGAEWITNQLLAVDGGGF
ncbi:MAG: SDR family oxidoreductase [Chloroflexi bacterium]|nr:SDR family oxidoreductase [Chloroflexota bacterium]